MARKKSSTRAKVSSHMHIVHAYRPLTPVLYKLAIQVQKEASVTRCNDGPKQIGRIRIPDSVILQIRICSEVERLTHKEIFEKFKDVCEESYIRKILNYEVRRRVVVDKD